MIRTDATRRMLQLLVFSVVLAAFFVGAAPQPAEDAIGCSGLWSPALTEAALVKQFGRANVTRGAVYVGEGVEEPGTILFPRDERRRVEIVWRDSKGRRRPEWIRVPAPSRWLAPDGLRTGLTLAEVEKLNGRPFKVYGFDWDFGGMVTDWRGGRLAKAGAPCRIQVRFDRTVPERMTRAQEKAAEATSGDRELLSSAAALRSFATHVSQVVISYPE